MAFIIQFSSESVGFGIESYQSGLGLLPSQLLGTGIGFEQSQFVAFLVFTGSGREIEQTVILNCNHIAFEDVFFPIDGIEDMRFESERVITNSTNIL